jgi:hypothetical protein
MLLLLLDPEGVIPGVILARGRRLDGTSIKLLVDLLS